ncbi:MAG: COX15/CtaA family protein [Rhodobiaceae bacterium]|nr:COX15/CtaA family protein [Rhodobiaceae bacterium]MCC0018278.1 COX15/CtaA family protein [Rhodobiaceae bacterium]MCC0060597.1 COX15/CtaA family protein [Rhodobiaceae bacterium]
MSLRAQDIRAASGPGAATRPAYADRAVRIWLLALAIAVVAMVMVGGATRLTDSGLSITEWKPVTGALPPLSEADWLAEFEKYQQIPEYRQINKGMTLDAFKSIYWWEWGHRLLGRFVGVLFIVPFVFFLARGWLTRRMMWLTFGAFLLGGMQGAVGWWMVASGLVERTDVSQYRLAAHLGMAVLIFAYLVWLSLQVGERPAGQAETWRISFVGRLVAPSVFLQILLGALVAGLDAGLAYPTWPLMDGKLVPDGLGKLSPWWLNAFENITTVQFDHRMFAYCVTALIAFHAFDAMRNAVNGRTKRRAGLMLAVTLVQVILGISALLFGVPIHVALAHQVVAIILFGIAVVHADALGRKSVPLMAQSA